ncbi:MAG: hypothetical protein WCF19_07140 [Chlamydiales bacterium]
MQLNINRFLSDRFVLNSHPTPNKLFRIAHSFWDWCLRVISWIWSPASYSDENRRTIDCFKKYLVDSLGEERLQRICSRYSIDLDQMRKKGSPLLSRDVAKIVIGAECVSIADVNEVVQKIPPKGWLASIFSKEETGKIFSAAVEKLKRPFGDQFHVKKIEGTISGRPTEWLSRFFFDPFLADRERLALVEEHPDDSFETFVHNMVARVIKREMEVGALIPAPKRSDGMAQFYYVSAKVVSGGGMVSYLLHPATEDTDLKPIRLFRGTSPRNSDIDAISTVITDLEEHLGKSAFESGKGYDPIIRTKLAEPKIEAGHSMGSTIVQWRLANTNHIEKAYLYCGPGIPESEVEKFNKKTKPVDLVIRASEGDNWSHLGEIQVGYNAPENVNVDFIKYHGPKTNLGQHPHITVWGKEPYLYGIEGGIPPKQRDREFYHKGNIGERIRSTLGPIFACFLRLLRQFIRWIADSRTAIEQGLKIGSFQNKKWQVDHFRHVAYNALS